MGCALAARCHHGAGTPLPPRACRGSGGSGEQGGLPLGRARVRVFENLHARGLWELTVLHTGCPPHPHPSSARAPFGNGTDLDRRRLSHHLSVSCTFGGALCPVPWEAARLGGSGHGQWSLPMRQLGARLTTGLKRLIGAAKPRLLYASSRCGGPGTVWLGERGARACAPQRLACGRRPECGRSAEAGSDDAGTGTASTPALSPPHPLTCPSWPCLPRCHWGPKWAVQEGPCPSAGVNSAHGVGAAGHVFPGPRPRG